jgi:hypothetical protein
MKISAQFAFWLALAFSAFCLAYSYTGFSSLAGMTDATERGNAQGYAWFWLFLGGVGLVFGALSWYMAKSAPNDSAGS